MVHEIRRLPFTAWVPSSSLDTSRDQLWWAMSGFFSFSRGSPVIIISIQSPLPQFHLIYHFCFHSSVTKRNWLAATTTCGWLSYFYHSILSLWFRLWLQRNFRSKKLELQALDLRRPGCLSTWKLRQYRPMTAGLPAGGYLRIQITVELRFITYSRGHNKP